MKLRTRLLGGAAGLLVLSAVFLNWGVDWFFSPAPPAWQGPQDLLQVPLKVEADGTTRVGESFRFRRQGVDACWLNGLAWERGVTMGRLFSPEIQNLEKSLLDTVARFIPSWTARWLLARFVLIRNHHLAETLPEQVLQEMQGVALATPDAYPEFGRHYARLINYLAAHDLSHALMDDRSLAGCTAFGATPRATSQGQMLLARNFDFEAGSAFDRYKVVLREQPEGGHAFLSVAWPSMFGVVSGLNDAGIGLVLLAGHSQDKPGVGTPISVVARQVLADAATLDEAIGLIRKARVFVSESFLIGSATENAFMVVEKTPLHCGVRGRQDAVVLATNHFLTEELKNDPKNLRYREVGTSEARFARLRERVQGALGQLDVPRCVDILRDHRAPGGGAQGWGNRQSINGLVASHSVVMDLKSQVIWVSAGPHTLGDYVPFSLKTPALPENCPSVPSDPSLANGQFEKYQRYAQGLARGERLLKQKKFREALACFMDIRALNPEHYRSFMLAGLALQALKHQDEARYNFEQAMALHPAYGPERRELEAKLRQFKEKEP